MKRQLSAIVLVLCTVLGCSEKHPNSKESRSDLTKREILQTHERITQESILTDFMSDVSERKYDEAISLLHPTLQDAWAAKRFQQDWESIREQIADAWKVEATDSFTGQSSQGPYQQAAYKLDSDWNSISSIDLIAMKSNGRERIIRIHIRVPYTREPPQSVINTADHVLLAFQNQDYVRVTELMTPNCRQQFPRQALEQLRPIIINDQFDVEKDFYRLCANTVWYDAVKLYPKGNSFTSIELILSSHDNTSEIETLSARGKM